MSEYSYRKRSREREIRKKRRLLICMGTASILALMVGVVVLIKVMFTDDSSAANDPVSIVEDAEPVAEEEQGVIKDGVFIAGTDVSGMDYAEVNQALDNYVAGIVSGSVELKVNKKTVTASLEDIGTECDTDSAISGAFALEEAGKVDLQFDIDEELFKEFIDRECRQYEVKPKNAKLSRVDGNFVVKKGKVGKTIDEAATRELLVNEINSSAAAGSVNIKVAAVINEEDPEYTSEDFGRVKDVIGKFSTNYQESQVQRSSNLKNAVGFIDGSIVYPGETFSVADTIYPLSADNGYKDAPSYQDGQVVDSLGGGVCQVSTTLYNAVLRAELQIVQRQNHSMAVSYVQASMDAAIAGDYKDLKFTNNTDTPIYIQGYAAGGTITFTVYGHETRPSSRKIEFVSEKVQTIDPGADIVTKDPNMKEGTEHVTQSAHVGCVANLYKIVYENGVEVSREKINSSRYQAEPRHVTIGTKKDDDKDKDEKDKDKDKKNKDKKDKDNTEKKDNSSDANNTPVTDAPASEPATDAPAPVQEEPAPQVQEQPVDGSASDGGAAGGGEGTAPDAAAGEAAPAQ